MLATTTNNRNYNEQNAKVKGGTCIFPFTYKRKKHTKCFPTERGAICATSISKYGTLKTYGYCPRKKSTAKKTLKKRIKLKQIKQKTHSTKKDTSMPSKKRKKLKQIKQKSHSTKKDSMSPKKMKRLNEEFIALLSRLEDLMKMKGEPMRARAYSKAQESIMLILHDITDPTQLVGVPGIGKTIIKKFKEYVDTGTLNLLEKAKTNPVYLFAKIHGIGPKKAKALVETNGITTMDQLEAQKNDVLNAVQLKGLKYFKDIQKRIPRKEIDAYKKIFRKEFKKIKGKSGTFEIVGSYRRGATTSGDIDLIISNDGKDKKLFHTFIDALVAKGIIVDILSKGRVKSMAVAQLPGKPARRVDFMYAPPKEYSFAILYFTGSKAFNVMMREQARVLGYSMNEHRFTSLKDKKPVDITFPTEKSIFDFLHMAYKQPHERKDGRAVVILASPLLSEEATIQVKAPTKNKTLKKKKTFTKKRLILFQTEGIALLKRLTEKQLSDMVRMANDLYFNKQPILLDNEYDILKEYLAKRFPHNLILTSVGAPIKKKKVKLPYFLPSMDKIKPDTKFLGKWMKKYKGPYVISAKADGVSGLLVTTGAEPELYTRGKGDVGTDISALIPFLDIPDAPDCVVRGELIMLKSVFKEKYAKTYKNARAVTAGIINADFSMKNASKYKDLNFVAYEVIKPSLKPSEQMAFLEAHHFITIKHVQRDTITNESLSTLLVDWRKNYAYQNDGLVVSDDHIYPRTKKNPKHSFAFKMVLSDQKAEAKVLEVIWTPSKDGLLKPKVRVEPVEVGDVTITYATAFNADFVEKNKIGMGAIVEMIRSGDVIPHIQRVITPARKAQMPPPPYTWNETHVDIIVDNIAENVEVQQKVISRFFKHLDVEGLGAGNVKRLMNAGFDSIEKIINMKKEDFLKAKGFKEKLADKVFTSIHEKLASASLVEIMAASNIFGRGMGKRRLQGILDAYPQVVKGDMSDVTDKIKMLKGFGEKTAKDFITHLKVFLRFIKKVHLENKLVIKNKKMNTKHPLFGKSIIMTGFRDKELEKEIIASTGKPLGTKVSKNTFVVIVKTMDEHTTKAQEAREEGIPLMTPATFRTKYLS